MVKSRIEVKDLSIGSWLNYDGDREVDSIIRWADGTFVVRLSRRRPSGFSDVLEISMSKCDPIKTDEDWLVKLGFVSIGYTCPEYGTKTNFPYRTEWINNMCLEIEDDFSVCIYDKNCGLDALGTVPKQLYTEVHLLQKLLNALS